NEHAARVAVAARLLKARRVDRLALPLFRVRIGLSGLFAAADLLFLLGLHRLDPLIHLGAPSQLQRVHRDAELAIAQSGARDRLANDVDALAVLATVDLVVLERDVGGAALLQALVRLARSSVVPPQERKRAYEQQKPDDDALHRLHEPREPTFRSG